MGCTRPHLRWARGLVAQESASERPASVRCSNRQSVLPLHGACSPCTNNTMTAHGSRDGTTPSLLLMVVDICLIRLQQRIVHRRSNNEESKPILGLSWIGRDMKRTNHRCP